jgi:omega-6 fatty acid desaturase (delta-12 desaturase)
MILLWQLQVSAWVILILSTLTAPVFVKIFIIFHDCCHTSYFKSRRACSLLGSLLGVLIFTAYADWQRTHGIHHNSVANLEKRGVGDVWLMTVEEYSQADWWTKFRYRLFRNPLVMLFVAPPFLFLILNRFPSSGFGRKQLKSVLFTDFMVLVMVLGLLLAVGWKGFLLMLLPMIFAASLLGVWLFYVQHQFRKVYWAHDKDWDRFRAAMEGCSFYTMPGILRWFTGNIGYHHIHHLSPRIPNYRLKECYDAIPELQKVQPVPFIGGIRNLVFCLYDEQSGELVSFREARKLLPGQ